MGCEGAGAFLGNIFCLKFLPFQAIIGTLCGLGEMHKGVSVEEVLGVGLCSTV